ncbi:MAG: LptF/LptG family permease [Candidatus Cloacimonetes bacterium]|jgi:lipopolysaccharide export system permease protein|nr:LptF/LptG family permease [Candidatus Cloacimonadota bacterium]
MKILDKYILKQYISNFLIIILSFSALFIIIDVFDRLPRLLKYSNDYYYFAQYFLLRIPYLFVLTSPIVVLLSGLFLMSTLSKYNESIAIRAAGISIFRMVRPLLILGIIVSIIIMIFGEYVLPYTEYKRNKIYTEDIKGQEIEDIKMRSNIFYSDNNFLFYLNYFDGYKNKIRVIDITEKDKSTGKIVRKIQANEAIWDGSQWSFINCYERHFDNNQVTYYNFQPKTNIPEITTTPDDFIKSSKSTMSMNYFELLDYINRLKKIGEKHHIEQTDLYMKVTFPFANFIILLFCIPLATASVRSKGRGVIFLMGIMICFLYLVTLRICQSLGYNEIISPLTATIFPHILFFIIGIYYLVKSEI